MCPRPYSVHACRRICKEDVLNIPAMRAATARSGQAVLWTVIAINGAMFFTEMAAGHLAGSQALKADALDFLADTVTYGLSLAVIGTTIRARATAALFKGLSLSLMAVWVLGSTIYHTFFLGLPSAQLMGGIGVLALAANLSSVLLLRRYKDGDANVRSVWLCSRNDATGNVVVMVAALGVWRTSTALVAQVQTVKHGYSAMTAAGFIRAAACGRSRRLEVGRFRKTQRRRRTTQLIRRDGQSQAGPCRPWFRSAALCVP